MTFQALTVNYALLNTIALSSGIVFGFAALYCMSFWLLFMFIIWRASVASNKYYIQIWTIVPSTPSSERSNRWLTHATDRITDSWYQQYSHNMHKNLDKWAAQRKTGIKPPGHSRISQDTSLHTAINNQQQTGWHRVIGARNGMLLARPFIFPPSKYFWKLSVQPPTECYWKYGPAQCRQRLLRYGRIDQWVRFPAWGFLLCLLVF